MSRGKLVLWLEKLELSFDIAVKNLPSDMGVHIIVLVLTVEVNSRIMISREKIMLRTSAYL